MSYTAQLLHTQLNWSISRPSVDLIRWRKLGTSSWILGAGAVQPRAECSRILKTRVLRHNFLTVGLEDRIILRERSRIQSVPGTACER